MKALEVLGLNIQTTDTTPILLLREQESPHRVLPIFVGGHEALVIALALSGKSPPRPLTHDLLAALIEGLDVEVDHVEVTEVRDGAFVADLALHGPRGGVSLDSRPSDAIALALRVDAPLFASHAVLDEAGTVVSVPGAEDTIDEDVARFRAFLDDIDPTEFEERHGRDDPPGYSDT